MDNIDIVDAKRNIDGSIDVTIKKQGSEAYVYTAMENDVEDFGRELFKMVEEGPFEIKEIEEEEKKEIVVRENKRIKGECLRRLADRFLRQEAIERAGGVSDEEEILRVKELIRLAGSTELEVGCVVWENILREC